MRISCDPDDDGHAEFRRVVVDNSIHVFLNGVELTHVVTADEELRMLVRYRSGPNGAPFIDPNRPDECATETLYGDVRVELRPRR